MISRLLPLVGCLTIFSTLSTSATTLPVNDNTSAPYFGSDLGPNMDTDQFYMALNRNVNGLMLCAKQIGYSSWDDIQAEPGQWFIRDASTWLANHPNASLVISVPMLPGYKGSNGSFGTPLNDPDGTPSSLYKGSLGDYDTYYQNLATNLVSYGLGNSVLRVGWEFNGTWYPWYVNSTAEAGYFVTYWQHIVTAMRSVPGANFKFLWGGTQSYVGTRWGSIDQAYPTGHDSSGKDYVDYVGTDVYDDWISGYTLSTAWGSYIDTTKDNGIVAWQNEACNYKKPFTIPEWGLASGTNAGGDDTTFIDNMYSLIQNPANYVYYASYYDAGGSQIGPEDGYVTAYPHSLAEYDGYFRLSGTPIYTYKFLPVGASTSAALDTSAGGGLGSAVVMNSPTSGTSQQWVLTWKGSNSYEISPAGNSTLSVTSSGTTTGSTVSLGSDTGASTQRWLIVSKGYHSETAIICSGNPGTSGAWLGFANPITLGEQAKLVAGGLLGNNDPGGDWAPAPVVVASAAAPVFNEANNSSSFVQFPVTLTSTTAGATIYYTTDGSTPTTSSASVTNGGSVTITQTETLKAIAGATGYLTSSVTAAAYYVTGQLAGGDSNTLALKSDGTVWIWGSYGTSAPAQVSGLSGIVSVSSAHNNQFVVKNDGTAWDWGSNSYGQLGTGTMTAVSTPTQIAGLTNVVSVAGGSYATVALKSDETVWTWGNNGNGALGNGTTTNSYVPVQVQTSAGVALTNVVAIGAGAYNGYAVTSGGALYAWGRDVDGELGDGGSTQQNYAKQILSSGVEQVYGGNFYAIFLKTDGTVWGMGGNNFGQLGDGTVVNPRRTPVQAIGLPSIIALACSSGGAHSVALDGSGGVWAYGSNSYGELGTGTTSSYIDTPTRVQASAGTNFTGAQAVGAGGTHSVAAVAGGAVWSWGLNGNGQLGDGLTANSAYPVHSGSIVLAILRDWNRILLLDMKRLMAGLFTPLQHATSAQHPQRQG